MSIKIPHLKDTTVNESCKVLLDGIEATFRDDNNILLIGNGFDIALGKKLPTKILLYIYSFYIYLSLFYL